MEHGVSQGDAGTLEWMHNPADSSHALILCHPHPLYGGSMLDGVLEIASQAAAKLDIASVRFNFRGVGASEGQHDRGEGERSDLRVIMEEFGPRYERLTLGGYSFGARVALSYAAQSESKSDLILVAPPTQGELPDLSNVVDLIVGDEDPISDAQLLQEWVDGHQNRRLHVVEDADHFLSMFDQDLSSIFLEVLGT